MSPRTVARAARQGGNGGSKLTARKRTNYRVLQPSVCRHCNRCAMVYARGLCRRCYRTPDIFVQYPAFGVCTLCGKPRKANERTLCWACYVSTRQAPTKPRLWKAGPCRNCGKCYLHLRARVLCYRCYDNPDIRARYPPQSKNDGTLGETPRLPKLNCYPNHTAIQRCACGANRDGECPQCEREQRKEIGCVETIDEFVV